MERRIAVRAIIVHDGRILAVKLKPYDTALAGDYWCTVGGRVNMGEALIPALEREVIEETGITPSIDRLLYVQQFTNENQEHLEFFFLVTNCKDFININLTKSSHGNTEIGKIAFINPKNEHILPAFLKDQDYSTLNNTVQFFNNL